MKKRFLSMILAVVLCGLLLAGCDGGGSTGTVPPAPEAPAVSAGVVSIKLLGASWEKKMDGYTYVYYSAELSNGNSKTAGACQITVTSWTNQKFPAMLSITALLIVPMSVSL